MIFGFPCLRGIGESGRMNDEVILALDQGTTSSRTLAFDRKGQVVASAQQEFEQYYPQSGWVEHDGEEIWESQLATLREVMAELESRGSGRWRWGLPISGRRLWFGSGQRGS